MNIRSLLFSGALCVPIHVHCRQLFCTAGSHGSLSSENASGKQERSGWATVSNDLVGGWRIIWSFTFGKVTQDVLCWSHRNLSDLFKSLCVHQVSLKVMFINLKALSHKWRIIFFPTFRSLPLSLVTSLTQCFIIGRKLKLWESQTMGMKHAFKFWEMCIRVLREQKCTPFVWLPVLRKESFPVGCQLCLPVL